LDNNFSYHISKFIDDTHLSDEFKDLGNYQASLWVLVGVGGLLFLVGFLGCCGAACESTILLSLFFVIVLIIAAIELGAAIFAVANKEQFRTQLEKALREGVNKSGFDQLKPIEAAFKCCGVAGATGQEAHQSICSQEERDGGDCVSKIWHDVESLGQVAIIIAFVVLVIELFSLIFSCVLCRAFREGSHGYYA